MRKNKIKILLFTFSSIFFTSFSLFGQTADDQTKQSNEKKSDSNSANKGLTTPIGQQKPIEQTADTAGGGGKTAPIVQQQPTNDAGGGGKTTQSVQQQPANNAGGGGEKGTIDITLKLKYKVKKQIRRGKYSVTVSSAIPKTLDIPFVANIGNMGRYKNDKRVFKEVNIDELFFKQREILPIIDGVNQSTFGDWLNFVNVRLIKKHERGATTIDEINVRKENLEAMALNGKLMYGNKEDKDPTLWNNYQVESTWSYIGVGDVKVPIENANGDGFTAIPPYKPSPISLYFSDTPPTDLRLVILKIYYQVNGKEIMKQVNIPITANVVLPPCNILLPANQNYTYDFEVIWRYANGSMKTTPKTNNNQDVIFLIYP